MFPKAPDEVLLFLNYFKSKDKSYLYWMDIFDVLDITYKYQQRTLKVTYDNRVFTINNCKHLSKWKRGNYIQLFHKLHDERLILNMQKYIIENI